MKKYKTTPLCGPQVWGQEKDDFLLRSHGSLNAWKENKQRPNAFSRCLEFGLGFRARKKTSFCLGHVEHLQVKKDQTTPPSEAGCRVPQVWGQQKDVFLPRSHWSLSAWKENKQHPCGRRTNNAPLNCLEFGVRKKVFLLRSHGALNTWKERVPRIWGNEKKFSFA